MKIGTVDFEVDSTKIQETDTTLVIPATIAREAGHGARSGKEPQRKLPIRK
jgi:hypothetical protein